MSYLVGDFNYLKFSIAVLGSVFIINGLFRKTLLTYFFSILIGWGLISYALALNRDAHNISDLDESRFVKIGMTYVLVIIGSLFLKSYRLNKNIKFTRNYKYTLILFFGIVFYILSKALLVIVELNLDNFSQYLTIISISMFTIGKIINTITSGDLLFYLSLIYYIVGFALFLFNLSYNPIEKVLISSHELKPVVLRKSYMNPSGTPPPGFSNHLR